MSDPAGSIGAITDLEGQVTIHTADGQTIEAQVGTPIARTDHIDTGADGHVEIKFVDGSQIALSPSSALDIQKFTFDQEGSDNGFIAKCSHGAFEFVAGKVAHLFGDGMQVETPAGTLGVRGTAGAARQNPQTGDWTFVLEKDPNGHLGKIVLVNTAGQVMLDEWMEASTMRANGNGIMAPPSQPHVLSVDEAHKTFGNVVGMIHELGNQINRAEPPHARQDWNSHPDYHADDAVHTAIAAAAFHEIAIHVPTNLAITHDYSMGSDELALADSRGTINDDNPLAGLFDDGGQVGAVIYHDDPILPINPTAANPEFFGTTGDDIIAVAAGDHTYHALSGNDIFHTSGSGNHVLDGGTGTDTADYSAATAGIHVDLSTGTASSNGFGGHDTLTSVENITGSNFNDYIDGRDGVHGVIQGGNGNDTLYGDSADNLDGGAGNNDLYMAVPTTGSVNGGSLTGINIWHVIDSANANIDLTALHSSGAVDQIARVDLSGSSGSSVALTLSDVLSFNSNHEIDILGNSTNIVDSLGQGWTAAGTATFNGHTFNTWTNGAAILNIEDTITAHLS